MQQHVSLAELYVYDSSLFKKSKHLNAFVKLHAVPAEDVVKLNGGKLAVTASWVASNITDFVLSLPRLGTNLVEAKTALAAYGCKSFNPHVFNLDSTMIVYLDVEKARVPYLTPRGVAKLALYFNKCDAKILDWVVELQSGGLSGFVDRLEAAKCMFGKPVFARRRGDKFEVCDNIVEMSTQDIVVDRRAISDLREELRLDPKRQDVEKHSCKLFTRLQTLHAEQLRELDFKKTVCKLEMELEKEKSLKDQALSLTQSSFKVPPKSTLQASKIT